MLQELFRLDEFLIVRQLVGVEDVVIGRQGIVVVHDTDSHEVINQRVDVFLDAVVTVLARRRIHAAAAAVAARAVNDVGFDVSPDDGSQVLVAIEFARCASVCHVEWSPCLADCVSPAIALHAYSLPKSILSREEVMYT